MIRTLSGFPWSKYEWYSSWYSFFMGDAGRYIMLPALYEPEKQVYTFLLDEDFVVHPPRGDLSSYLSLVQYLSQDRPVYGIQAIGLIDGQEPVIDIETMA